MRVPPKRIGVASELRLASLILVCGALCLAGLGGCRSRQPPKPAPPASAISFRDVTGQTGIQHIYHNGRAAERYTILETLGGGLALVDYDNDQRLDLVATGGGTFGPDGQAMGRAGLLFRNQGELEFGDVTLNAGFVSPPFYTHGFAAADYDNDGFDDLLTNRLRRTSVVAQPGRRDVSRCFAATGLGGHERGGLVYECRMGRLRRRRAAGLVRRALRGLEPRPRSPVPRRQESASRGLLPDRFQRGPRSVIPKSGRRFVRAG